VVRKKKTLKQQYSWLKNKIETLIYSIFLSACIGGRIGCVLFYNFSYFSQNILHIFYIWEGGMSFHGGLIGATIAISYFSLKYQKPILEISDFIIPLVPFGLGAGRIGNFINGELWGRVSTDYSYGMIFPNAKQQDIEIASHHPKLQTFLDQYGGIPRHPSQLYELFLEGLVLFLIIYFFTKKNRPIGSVSGIFLIFYGLFRFIVEFFREPDPSVGLLKNIISMGQLLSIPMIIIGLMIMCSIFYQKDGSSKK